MGRPKKNSSPEGEQAGTTEENAQGNEALDATPDKNSDENEGQQEGGTTEENAQEGNAEESGEDSTESPTDELPEKTNIPTAGDGGNNSLPTDMVSVVSETRKGKTIYAASGKPITFDDNGNATVNELDALYLKQCPGFIVG